MWTGSGAISFDRRLNVLTHTIDTTPGQSGAPVWFMRNGKPCLVGIHSRAGTLLVGSRARYLDNIAVLLTPEVLRQVETWKRTFAR
jgi:V8-like Glu-specific endopeptidase